MGPVGLGHVVAALVSNVVTTFVADGVTEMERGELRKLAAYQLLADVIGDATVVLMQSIVLRFKRMGWGMSSLARCWEAFPVKMTLSNGKKKIT